MTCHVCTAKSDANLCRRHTDELQQAIAELPGLLADLNVTITRQDRGVGHAEHELREPLPSWWQPKELRHA